MKETKTVRGIPKRPLLFYGYIIVAIATIIMMLGSGTRASFGVFFMPMATEFGWTRALTSGAITLSMITQGIWGIFMGRLNDKFGPRLLITLCCFLSGMGILLMSNINSVWQIYVFYGIIVGLGMGGVFVVLLSTVSRWFIKRRGAMTGIVLSGVGLGSLITSPAANWLILVFDWRSAYAIVGGVVIIIGIILAQFLRRDPSKKGLQPHGYRETASQTPPTNNTGASLPEALHTWQFWITVPIFISLGYCLFAITVHIVPFVTDTGISTTAAANVLALCGGAQVIGGLVLGKFIDNFGSRRILAFSFLLMAISIAALVPYTDFWIICTAAFFFGAGIGGGVVTESTIIAEMFGMKSHGLILGVISFAFTIGGAIGPLITGYIFDVSGNYQTAFLVFTILSIAGLALTATLRPVKNPRLST